MLRKYGLIFVILFSLVLSGLCIVFALNSASAHQTISMLNSELSQKDAECSALSDKVISMMAEHSEEIDNIHNSYKNEINALKTTISNIKFDYEKRTEKAAFVNSSIGFLNRGDSIIHTYDCFLLDNHDNPCIYIEYLRKKGGTPCNLCLPDWLKNSGTYGR